MSLKQTLQKYLGFSKFRHTQLECINSILSGRDTCVFWSTGSGKSLVYTLPPLHTGRPAVVVSPLISLMRDQTYKLNAAAGSKVSTFLGSAQFDPGEEAAALRGERQLVFVTPEKLELWLDQIAGLHSRVGLSLIAIDEAHCASQWGHDFRPSFLNLRKIREDGRLNDVPLVALTGTSTTKVKSDIETILKLRSPYVATNTVDRPNLNIRVLTRALSGGYKKDLAWLPDAVNKDRARQSTIVYVSTQRQVESVCDHLNEVSPGISARYHAGLPAGERDDSHIGFLTGKFPIIVATTAFGMGIDKPDTRRVVHYTPPGSFEEYYQQIGRAGRDGDSADCVMYCTASDFDKFGSDFYSGGYTSEEAREESARSTAALKNFATKPGLCRRAAILSFFNEEVGFKDGRCGTCDNCRSLKSHGDDTHRDFRAAAMVCLCAARSLKDPAMGTLNSVMSGKIVEDWRYAYGASAQAVQGQMEKLKLRADKKQRSAAFLKNMVTLLVSEGFLSTRLEKRSIGGRSSSWSVYNLTAKGAQAMKADGPVMLAVPASIRQQEDEDKEKRKQLEKKLEAAGVDVKSVPESELEGGEGGQVTRALLSWNDAKNANLEHTPRLQDLEKRVLSWRQATAEAQRTAPGNVMSEDLLARVCYVSKNGAMEEEALRGVGVRSGVKELCSVLAGWASENGIVKKVVEEAIGGGERLNFAGFAPSKWAENTKKEGGKIEERWIKWSNGDTCAAIAASNQPKAIQEGSVMNNIHDAFFYGRATTSGELERFLGEVGWDKLPTTKEWETLRGLEDEAGKDVKYDQTMTVSKLIGLLPGYEFCLEGHPSFVEYKERSDDMKAKFGKWAGKAKWYLFLRRIGYTYGGSENSENKRKHTEIE